MKKISFKQGVFIVLFILCMFSSFIILLKHAYLKNKTEEITNNLKNIIEDTEKDNKEIMFQDERIGILKIPSINIEAPICEGTDSETLKYTIGHFKETSLWDGNVALASHNEGSYAHYFAKIKNLKNGEEIIYVTNMGERRYIVSENKIIKETNVDILKNTDENTITLVTCVTGKKEYRRCVIGKEKFKEE